MEIYTRSKKAKVTEKGDLSIYNYEFDLEKEQVPSNTYKSGSNNISHTYHRKGKLPVTTSGPSSKREVLQSILEISRDENQVSTSGYNSSQKMTRSKDKPLYSNQIVVNASRARLNQHYGRFLTVIFSAKHIEVKKSKDILACKWDRKDLCAMKSFYNFFPENAKNSDGKALVVLILHNRRVFKPQCSGGNCTISSDLTQTLVLEIGNEEWRDQQKELFQLCPAYQDVWKRIEGEEYKLYKGKLSRHALGELSINGNLARDIELEIIPETSSPPARLNQEALTFETLVYPLGDPDAVTITSKDVEILRPMGFLNDTIIDFYVKYLQTNLPVKDKERFYFFNSFFFRKLVDSSKKYTGPDKAKVVYERVRKWTRKVSLFEKDYIFIPVNQSLHWSLVIVCHLGSLGRSSDKRRGTPCILHLDSMEGSHDSIEEHIRNYILQAWKEGHPNSGNDSSESILSEMMYIEATVPQQMNHCDCGSYLLHFVELFLKKAPQYFSLAASEGFPYFLTRNWFRPSEASAKRNAIRNLLIKLHQDSLSGATDRQATPLLEQAALSSTSEESGDANELLLIEEDDVCISSATKAIHSNLVATLRRQIIEESVGSGKRAGSTEAGPAVQTPLIVDLFSDDEANEASPSEEDWHMRDAKEDKLCPSSSSFSARGHSSNPFSSSLSSGDIPGVTSSSEVVSYGDSVRCSSSAVGLNSSSIDNDDDFSKRKLGSD
ncbi:hypothetical protein M758_7G080000 [Ceratodon purpureus]|nr:hypothetical protein M758_7G080000 [Ceratodon purpureus]